MTASEKAKKVDLALRRLAGEIIDDREGVSDDDAMAAYEAIENFIKSAPIISKARLLDSMTSN